MTSHCITATEIELVTFFATESKPRDEDAPWPYNDFDYTVTQGDLVLTFSVAPAYKDVRIVLTRAGATVYEFNALTVDDVLYRKDGGREVLEIVVNSGSQLFLSLQPGVSISHSVSEKIRY